jgi:hypothetical protein
MFAPITAWRVHPDNNNDTPLPPETPAGENPASGAVVDYWIGADADSPATLEFFDGNGQLVRRFSSSDIPRPLPAERYFAKAWTKPPRPLSATPGMHRFVWNLRYGRPDAAEYSYSIAAVWGRATPIEPEGAWVLPGTYTVALTVDGKRHAAPLTVVEDPRVKVSTADLQASLALSQKIAPALTEAALGYREQRALESADAAPTPAQEQFVDDALVKLSMLKREWEQAKLGSLASLNAALARAGENPVVIPDKDKLTAQEPDEGEDLP